MFGRAKRWLTHHMVILFVATVVVLVLLARIDERRQNEREDRRNDAIRATQIEGCERNNVRVRTQNERYERVQEVITLLAMSQGNEAALTEFLFPIVPVLLETPCRAAYPRIR